MSNQTKVIGVDLGGTKLHVGLVQNGKIIESEKVLLPQDKLATDCDAIVNIIIETIAKLDNNEAKVIGVGVPSVVDRERGIVYDVQNIPSWKLVPLKEILEQRFKIPAFIDNDANCFAIGEKFYGQGHGFENFVGLTIGTGIGGGVINRGRLLSDHNCGSGEFGEMYYLDSRIEDYCSGQFFKNKHGVSGKELFARAEKGDSEAQKIFAEFGRHLGRALKMIMCAVDPEAFIFGGSIIAARPYFEPAMREELKNFTFPRSVERLKIEFSTLKNLAILGAAALGLASLKG